jgi:hypothetical protein
MKNDMDDLIEAVNKIADTSFDATAAYIAKRPSGSTMTGFYRPGERSENGAPFEVSPTKCPKYIGLPSGRTPSNEEKRGAWQLQAEYLEGRLGKNDEENSRNWNTATWIDRLIRTATMPAEAVKGSNLYTDTFHEVTDPIGDDPNDDPADENEEYEVEKPEVDRRRDKNGNDPLAIEISDYDLVMLWDYFKECDYLAKIDVNKLAGKSDPLPQRIELPGPIERQEAIKILRILMLGMRLLWHPVIRSIVNHATMNSLGKTQGVGDKVAATVGRTRVIEGLRLAESIRKGLARQERGFSMWLNQTRARQTPIQKPGLTAARLKASVDEIIKEVLVAVMKTAPVVSMPMIGDYEQVKIRQDNDSDTPTHSSLLATLPDKSLPKPVRAPPGHYWNLAVGPVIKIADKLLPANDNCSVEAVASKAA